MQKMSLTFKLKMVFSVQCFFFKPASWHLLLYQYRSIHFDTHISKEHSPIKSCVPCAPFILWAPAPPKVSARPWFTVTVWDWQQLLTGERLEMFYLFSRLKHLIEYISVWMNSWSHIAFRTLEQQNQKWHHNTGKFYHSWQPVFK